MATILVIEDERTLRSSIRQSLEMDGHRVSDAENARDALELFRSREPDAIITDVNLPGESGLDLLDLVRADGYDGVVIVMTAYGAVDAAVDAMKRGADEYVQKPIRLEEMSLLIEKALKNRGARSRLRLYERLDRVRGESSDEAIGESRAWKDALALASRFAAAPIPSGPGPSELPAILLLGETGAGKGVIARHIHRAGRRNGGTDQAPFVHVNCAALPASLIESELFGHEKGAFTDAREARPGLFELAEGGVIFLDEIGELPIALQPKLLLAVETGRFRRLGGSKERTARARIIAATNLDLEECVRQGTFRRDLLYRLNALTIRIPPLRERGDDVALIARALIERLAAQHGRPAPALTDDALGAMRAHTWPGNVRELTNVLKRAMILSDGDSLSAADLGLAPATPASMTAAATPGSNGLSFDFTRGPVDIDYVERSLIVQALRHAEGNVSRAARLIGLNRGALRYRIERLELEPVVQEIAAQ